MPSWERRYGRYALRRLAGPRTRAVGGREVEQALRRQWDEAAVAAHRDALLGNVLAAAGATAYYPAAVGDAAVGAITNVDELARLPVLPRAELRSRTAALANTALSPEEVDVTFTSGTQGAASHVLRSRSSLRHRAICERRWYRGLGLPWVFDITCATPWPGSGRDNAVVRDSRVGYREEGVDTVLERLGRNRIGSELLLVGPDMVPALAARVTRWDGVVAVASSFEVLRPEHARGWRPEFPPLVQMYCAAEISVPLAFSFPECTGMHVNADYLHLEVVDDDGRPQDYGRAGRLAVTDLVDTAMPLLRYLIGDAAILRPPSDCGCGRVLPLVEVLGRLPDGDRMIAQVPVHRLLTAASAVTEHGFVLEHRDEETAVMHVDRRDDAERVAAALRTENAALEVDIRPLAGPLTDLACPQGRVLSVAARHPYREGATATMPHRIRAVHAVPGPTSAGPSSSRSLARRLLRERYRAAGTTTEISILDASRSMSPLFGTATRVRIAWGTPDPAAAVGSIALVELPQDILAAHRIAAWRTGEDGTEILQCADNYDRNNPYSAFWVPLDSVLGTVIAARTTRRAKTTTVHLIGPVARRSGRIVAAADRWVVAAQRRRLPLAVVLAAVLTQRIAFRITNVVLRLVGAPSHRLERGTRQS
ncbi:hypothetical protein [Nocardia transvalensis]|uniref:hypothetical protein n=1 Tax=Nocardia transvalensis TaxID=37333 RepID=UPI00189566C8|nr:hypothetical protein [Nocardia transvalensis]MBF6328297.1 hypothetical protein [Nocardia transvalensis]